MSFDESFQQSIVSAFQSIPFSIHFILISGIDMKTYESS